MDVFKGQMIHSQRYRDPEEFRGKRVLVVGGGPSGIDISIEISDFAEKSKRIALHLFNLFSVHLEFSRIVTLNLEVHDSSTIHINLCYNKSLKSTFSIILFAAWLCQKYGQKISISDKIYQVGEIVYLSSDSALVCKAYADDRDERAFSSHIINHEDSGCGLKNTLVDSTCDNSKSDNIKNNYLIGPIDVILFCTGFYHSYPFLSADCGIAVMSHKHVGPLYKDLVCMSRPTLSLIGHFSGNVQVIMFDCQAQILAALYEGRISLPVGEKLEEDVREYDALKLAHGVDVHMNPFKIHHFQWIYYRHLASIGKFATPPYCVEELVNREWNLRIGDLVNYKNQDYVMGDRGLYVDAEKEAGEQRNYSGKYS